MKHVNQIKDTMRINNDYGQKKRTNVPYWFARVTAVFILLVAFLINVTAQKVGDIAPNFTISTLSGSDFTLSDHEGKVVLLFFFGNTCPSCLTYGPSIQEELVEPYAGNDEFVAIGLDSWDGSAALVQNFKDATMLDIPLGLMAGNITNNYSSHYDRLIVIGKNGTIVFKGTTVAGATIDDAMAAITRELILTSVDNITLQETDTRVYPNPVADKLYIQGESLHTSKIYLFDISGKQVSSSVSSAINGNQQGTIELDFSAIQNGIYSLVIEKDGNVRSYKISVVK